jgi:hypothetical protein
VGTGLLARRLGEVGVKVGVNLTETPSAHALVPIQCTMLATPIVEPSLDHGQFNAAAVAGHDARTEQETDIFHDGTRSQKTNHFGL